MIERLMLFSNPNGDGGWRYAANLVEKYMLFQTMLCLKPLLQIMINLVVIVGKLLQNGIELRQMAG